MIAKVEPLTTARALRGPFDYRLPREMAGVDVGAMLEVPFGRRRLLGVVVGVADESELPPERLVEPLEALGEGAPPELVRLGLWVAEEYCSTPARGLALVLPPGTGTGARARPPVRRTRRQGPSRPASVRVGAVTPTDAVLTPAQEAAVAEVVARMDGAAAGDARARCDRRLLLHGVTGSGKTEVYLRAVAAALERGRSAIVLVPSIALTPQTAGRFEERFDGAVAVLHSRLGAGERYDEWLRLRRGEARVCVGARSAVFAPLTDLGLIVVDEEHDPSYKQEGDPRYDARRVAERRAEESGAVLVAGSATPRPETWLRLRRLGLPERIDGRALPPVELVEMGGRRGTFHARTREALEEVRLREEKAIVLLNRRGWSSFLSCRGCGRVWGCRECDVSLVLHRSAGRLACHHCGHAEAVPAACPGCGSVSLARHGAGTERLERELESLVDPLPVFRLDSDSVAGRGGGSGGSARARPHGPGAARRGAGELLRRFDSARGGVLVGTQMVAKGHDFPDVTLGVVLDADATLRFPDFRSEERTFALVAQLAGRSGRGPRGGRVIVQALDPEARPLRHAAAHDAEGFVAGELERRETLGYPPFAQLVRVVCSSREQGAERAAADALRELIEAPLGEADPEASVLGPAALFRRGGRERAQILVKARDRAAAVGSVRRAVELVAGERSHRGVSFSVDVDPQ